LIRDRVWRFRQCVPHLKGLIAYAYRHSFATDLLVNGVGIAQVTELLGHTSTDMVMRHSYTFPHRRITVYDRLCS
jgi:site-specific recombinase XerD